MHTDPLSLLARRLSGLAARRPGFALTLCGEAGIGKSFTVRALLQGCSSASFSTPATRSLSSVLSALPRPKKCPAPLEGTLKRLKRNEGLEQSVVLEALSTLLGALAPFVLYLEDLHEAAADQLETLSRLAERVSFLKGVALLSSSRTPPPAPFETLALERLSPIQSRELLEGEIFAPLPPDALGWIYSRAAGNPLYALEFFRSLARAGNAWSDGRHWHWRAPPESWVPVSVEALIERVLLEAAHTPNVQAALETLALLPEADADLRCAVSQLEHFPFEAALQHLRARGVLGSSGFAHPLYRELALKNLSPGSRQTLSSRALEALKSVDVEAAAEFIEAAAPDRERALELLKRAASSAKERGDLPRAGHFLATAVEFAAGVERGELALEASVYLEGSRVADSKRLVELALHEMPGHLQATLQLAGKVVSQSRRVEDAEPFLAQLPPELRRSPEVHSARLGFHVVCGDFVGALEVWHHMKVCPLDASSAYYVAASLAQTGRFLEAEEVVAAALEAPDLTPQTKVRLLNVRGMAQTFLGDARVAELAQQQAIGLAREHRLYLVLAASLQNYALNLERTERFEERLAAAQESVEAYQRVGESQRALNAQLVVVDSLLGRGDYAEAETLLLECWEGLRASGPSAYLLAVECAFVKLYLDWNHAPARALAEKFAFHALRDAHILSDRVAVTAYVYAMSALVEARWGDPVRAEEQAQRAVHLAGDASNQLAFIVESAFAAALEAQGKPEAAQVRFEKAALLAHDKGFELDAQIYALEVDRLSADLESARIRLEWFEARGRIHGANLVQRYFPDLVSSTTAYAAHTETPLRLEVLGPLRLEGQLVRGGKRQELLKVLLEARVSGKSELSTLELLEALYPGEDEEPAQSALKATVFKTRSSYGAGLITTTNSGYALGNVLSDAEEFLKGGGETRLWRGVYSPPEGSGAALETLSLALESAVKGELERDPQEAVRAARILCEMDPYTRESLKLLCSALKASGNYKSLAREYEKGRVRLLEVGETLPHTWNDFLRTFVPA